MSSDNPVPRRCSQCNDLRVLKRPVTVTAFNENCTFCHFLETLVGHFVRAQQEQYDFGRRLTTMAYMALHQRPGQAISVIAYYDSRETNLSVGQETLKSSPIGLSFAIFSGSQAGPLSSQRTPLTCCPAPHPFANLPALPAPPPFNIQDTADSAAAFVLEKTKHCSAKHGSGICTTAGDARPMPKRVLSIGTLDSPALTLVQDAAHCGRYATLSYCWGGAASVQLTKASLAGMLRGLCEKELPVLFQDAITLARKLDIDHIWIDCLCILQDSGEDWELESSKMGHYFNSSTLTISAVSSPNPHVSLFEPRPSYWGDVSLKFGTADLVARPVISALDLTQLGPAFTRAWTFQEIALSRRVFHFTPQGLAWDCVYGWSSDFHVEGDPGVCSPHLQRMMLESEGQDGWPSPSVTQTGQELEREENASYSRAVVHMAWEKCIGEYSGRALCYEIDRLPALSGIASIFASVNRSRYLAGLWENQLPTTLLWQRFPVSTYYSRVDSPRNYVAPSWSWASINARVYWAIHLPHLFQASTTILDIFCEVSGLNPFGTVSSNGHMVIRGRVVRVSLTESTELGYFLSGPDTRDWSCRTDAILEHHNGELYRAGAVLRSPEEPVLSLAMAWAFYVGSEGSDQEERRLARYRPRHYALLLGPSRSEQGSYCRVGLAYSKDDPKDDPMKLFDGAKEQTLRIM